MYTEWPKNELEPCELYKFREVLAIWRQLEASMAGYVLDSCLTMVEKATVNVY